MSGANYPAKSSVADWQSVLDKWRGVHGGEELINVETRTYVSPNRRLNRSRIDWVSQRIALGHFPSGIECVLRDEGVTHLLNLGDDPYSEAFKKSYFMEAVWSPVDDLSEILYNQAVRSIFELHRMLHSCEEARVYAHCSEGVMRSPNIVWLYLVGLGVPDEVAEGLIVSARPKASPNNPIMVSENLIERIRLLGRDDIRAYRQSIIALRHGGCNK